jgi:hypothetical protein
MVAKDQCIVHAEISDQTRFLIVVQRDALVIVIPERHVREKRSRKGKARSAKSARDRPPVPKPQFLLSCVCAAHNLHLPSQHESHYE